MHLLWPTDTNAPIDPSTGLQVTHSKDRIEEFFKTISQAKERVLVPTPALAEVLVGAGSEIYECLSAFKSGYAFEIGDFDERAAIEVALITDADLSSKPEPLSNQTKAKVKYDRQILAISAVHKAEKLCTCDSGLAKKAKAYGLEVIGLHDLPLPESSAQGSLDLAIPSE